MKFSGYFVFVCLAVALSSCSKDIEESGELYRQEFVIQKGNHYSDWFAGKYSARYSPDTLFLAVLWVDSVAYTTKDRSNQTDKNMLFGLNENMNSGFNSVRIAWNWNPVKNCMVYSAYTYEEKERTVIDICEVDYSGLYKPVYAMISVSGFRYTVAINEKQVHIPIRNPWNTAHKFFSYPYFGGSEKAPHNFRLFVEILNRQEYNEKRN